jgi:hypothetical protein
VLQQAVAACKALPLCGSRSYCVLLEIATHTITATVLRFQRLRRDNVVLSLAGPRSRAPLPGAIR